jgi:hypothetical protein
MNISGGNVNTIMTTSLAQKENNKNSVNTGGKEYYGGSKKFTGANELLRGKVFDVTSRYINLQIP